MAIPTSLPGKSDVEVRLPADTAPQAKGGSKRVELLILGIPRRCTLTQDWPPSKDVVERFYREFGLDGGPGGYRVSLEEGRVLSRRYVLKVDVKASGQNPNQPHFDEKHTCLHRGATAPPHLRRARLSPSPAEGGK